MKNNGVYRRLLYQMSSPSVLSVWRSTARAQIYISELLKSHKAAALWFFVWTCLTCCSPPLSLLSTLPGFTQLHNVGSQLVSLFNGHFFLPSLFLWFCMYCTLLWVTRSWLLWEHFVSCGITKECKWALLLCTSPSVSAVHRAPALHVPLASPAFSPAPRRLSLKLIGPVFVFTWKPIPLPPPSRSSPHDQSDWT